MLIAGGAIVAAAALLAGASGFGFGLLATPLLLLAGFSLPFVVTINLLISVATRVSVAYRFRASADGRRVALLVGGSVPGLVLGAVALNAVNEGAVKIAAGVFVMAAAALLAIGVDRPAPRPHRGAPLAAGFAGGFLGTTTSLIGIPPVLYLAREKLTTATFYADLAFYFIAASSIGVGVLAAAGALDREAVFPAFVAWLPFVLVANVLGTLVGVRVPERRFRLFVLALAFAAGAVTAATA